MKPFSQAGADIAARMTKIATAIDKGNRDTLIGALKVAKAEHQQVINLDSGGDGRLSGMGRAGVKVGARYDITSTAGDAAGRVMKTGPLQILANPTKAHAIPRKRARGGRRYVVIPGVGVRSSVNHPGTKGKDTWARGRKQASPQVEREVSKRTTNVIRRAM